MKKIITIMMFVVVAALFASCSNTGGDSLKQFEPPANGDEIAVIETSMGTIKLRLFPEAAPKAVENFTTHAKDGYYDGLTFHRVIEGFMIQGGDPEGTGQGGESIWGEGFGEEYSLELHHVRGALAMAKSVLPNSQGSQFYIVQAPELDPDMDAALDAVVKNKNEKIPTTEHAQITSYEKYIDNNLVNYAGATGTTGMTYGQFFDEAILEKYREAGGVPVLDFGYTVFGQVIEGMDVVDKIAVVETNKDDKPLEDVYIISIKIEAYSGN